MQYMPPCDQVRKRCARRNDSTPDCRMNKNEGRFAALFLGIAAPLGFWLGLEYLNQQPAPAAEHSTAVPMAADTPHGPPAAATQAEAELSPRMARPAEASVAGGVFRCRQGDRIIYTDRPAQQCGADSPATRLAPVAASAGIAPARPYQQQLAELERERARVSPPPAVLTRQVQGDLARGGHEQRCRDLAAEIVWIDGMLRQPHGAHTGDELTARRRRANDRRFEEHC